MILYSNGRQEGVKKGRGGVKIVSRWGLGCAVLKEKWMFLAVFGEKWVGRRGFRVLGRTFGRWGTVGHSRGRRENVQECAVLSGFLKVGRANIFWYGYYHRGIVAWG